MTRINEQKNNDDEYNNSNNGTQRNSINEYLNAYKLAFFNLCVSGEKKKVVLFHFGSLHTPNRNSDRYSHLISYKTKRFVTWLLIDKKFVYVVVHVWV